MVSFTILTTIVLGLIGLALLAVFGTAFIAVAADLIVCGLFIALIVRLFKGKKN